MSNYNNEESASQPSRRDFLVGMLITGSFSAISPLGFLGKSYEQANELTEIGRIPLGYSPISIVANSQMLLALAKDAQGNQAAFPLDLTKQPVNLPGFTLAQNTVTPLATAVDKDGYPYTVYKNNDHYWQISAQEDTELMLDGYFSGNLKTFPMDNGQIILVADGGSGGINIIQLDGTLYAKSDWIQGIDKVEHIKMAGNVNRELVAIDTFGEIYSNKINGGRVAVESDSTNYTLGFENFTSELAKSEVIIRDGLILSVKKYQNDLGKIDTFIVDHGRLLKLTYDPLYQFSMPAGDFEILDLVTNGENVTYALCKIPNGTVALINANGNYKDYPISGLVGGQMVSFDGSSKMGVLINDQGVIYRTPLI